MEFIKSIITSPLFITVMTFLWYRRGRLWKFYYNVLNETKEQFTQDKLNRIRWEEMSQKYINELTSVFFGVLFKFEIDYLGWFVLENKHTFWVGDCESISTTTLTKDLIYQNKTTTKEYTPEYCESEIDKMFSWKFLFFGVGLFINSLCWRLFKKKRNKGLKETTKTTNITPKDIEEGKSFMKDRTNLIN